MMSLLLTDNFNQYFCNTEYQITDDLKVQNDIIDCESEKMSFCIMLQSLSSSLCVNKVVSLQNKISGLITLKQL